METQEMAELQEALKEQIQQATGAGYSEQAASGILLPPGQKSTESERVPFVNPVLITGWQKATNLFSRWTTTAYSRVTGLSSTFKRWAALSLSATTLFLAIRLGASPLGLISLLASVTGFGLVCWTGLRGIRSPTTPDPSKPSTEDGDR
jgi:hypothetical protein